MKTVNNVYPLPGEAGPDSMVAMIRLASARCDDVMCCVICTTESMATSGLSDIMLQNQKNIKFNRCNIVRNCFHITFPIFEAIAIFQDSF